MIKIATMVVAMLVSCCITFMAIPPAFGFEDYITGESAQQGEVMENDPPAEGESGFYYDVPAYEEDEKDTIGDQEAVGQDENQNAVMNLDDEEQAAIK